jgi:hypothetical protein
MTEIVQITAQYSNAVLVAILPFVSDFSQRLNLPVSTPVTPAHVLQFKCDPRKDHVGGLITLTNGCQFSYLSGRVCIYRSPHSYYSLQNSDLIPRFYGPVLLKERAALKIARNAVEKLGYADEVAHAGTVPKVEPPEKFGENFVPR